MQAAVLENARFTFDKFSQAENFLLKRHTVKVIIRDIKGIEYVDGKFYLNLRVIEPETELLLQESRFFMPEHTLRQLFNFLDIPTAVIDYFKTLNELNSGEAVNAMQNEASHLF